MNHLFSNRKKATIAIALIAIIAVSSGIYLQNNSTTQAALINPHPGLAGWWSFNEGSGTMAGDSSGNGNNGTIYGASWVPGRFGQALSFNGVNNYVEIPNNNAFNSQFISVSAWFQRSGGLGTNWIPLVGKWNNNWIFYFKSDNHLQFYIKNPDSSERFVTSTTVFNDLNTWHQVVGTYDGSNIKIYVDGKLEGTTPNVAGILTGSAPVRIGRDQVADYFNGIIDEVRVYSRSLSATEIQAEYSGGPDLSANVFVKVPQGTTQVFATLSWQGTASINATIISPSQTYTESSIPVYQKTTYSTSDGLSSMMNIKRLSVSVSALPTDQNWNVTLTFDNPVPYQITVEVQK
jgi:hypothetical protein